jgi:hypothetical protein
VSRPVGWWILALVAAITGCEFGGGSGAATPGADAFEAGAPDPGIDTGTGQDADRDDGQPGQDVFQVPPDVRDVPSVQEVPVAPDTPQVQDTPPFQDTPSAQDLPALQDVPPADDGATSQDPSTVEYGPDTDVVITELLYNPPSSADDEEFIELYNRGVRPVRIGGWTFTGVDYTFPEGVQIGPGETVVCAKKPALHPGAFGPWKNSTGLNNTGETITLGNAAGVEIDVVPYLPEAPWPLVDGTIGQAIEIADAHADNAQPESWHVGPAGGTPGVFPPG